MSNSDINTLSITLQTELSKIHKELVKLNKSIDNLVKVIEKNNIKV